MTKDDAARILEVPLNAKSKHADEAYARKRTKYLAQAQYATDPRERDVANNALGLLQDAYRTLTGKFGPILVKPTNAASARPSQDIRRVSLSVSPARSAKTRDHRSPTPVGNGKSRTLLSRFQDYVGYVRPIFAKSYFASPESAPAMAISAAMFLIALSIVVSIACRGR